MALSEGAPRNEIFERILPFAIAITAIVSSLPAIRNISFDTPRFDETALLGSLKAMFILAERAAYGTSLMHNESPQLIVSPAVRKIVQEIKDKHNIKVVTPETWNGAKNYRYSLEETRFVRDVLGQLPEAITNNSLPELHLIKTEGGGFQGSGGLSSTPETTFIIDKSFNLRDKVEETDKTNAENLAATISHELAHGYIDQHPKILTTWIKQIGWSKGREGWTVDPDQKLNNSNGDSSPYEHIAHAYSLWTTDPDKLSTEQRAFFEKNPSVFGPPGSLRQVVISYTLESPRNTKNTTETHRLANNEEEY